MNPDHDPVAELRRLAGRMEHLEKGPNIPAMKPFFGSSFQGKIARAIYRSFFLDINPEVTQGWPFEDKQTIIISLHLLADYLEP